MIYRALLHAFEPTDISVPQTYYPQDPPADSNCPLCRAGRVRWVAERGGHAHHGLMHSCVHGRCQITHWAVMVALAVATVAVVAWPFVKVYFR